MKIQNIPEYFITSGNSTKQLSKKQFEKQTGWKTEQFSDLFQDLFEKRGCFDVNL